MSRLAYVAAALFLLGTAAAQAAGNLEDTIHADLIYNSITGNVTMDASDTASGKIVNFLFGTDQNNMRPRNLVESSPGDWGPFLNLSGEDFDPWQIGQTDPLNQGVGPVFDLGDIFPPKIANSPEELSSYLTLAQYASDLDPIVGGEFDLVVVPEPNTAPVITTFVVAIFFSKFSVRNRRAKQIFSFCVVVFLVSAIPALGAGNLDDTEHADLIYNRLTGNVTMDASDTASGKILSFVFATDQNNMRPQNLVESSPGDWGPFIELDGDEFYPFQIGQTDPLKRGVGPVFDLGDIFPPEIGESPEGLASYLTLAEYASELGAGGMFDLIVVPEPSSGAIAFGFEIAILCCFSRRRLNFFAA